jgi:type IX secretion system PorP/SprF family membrane protein
MRARKSLLVIAACFLAAAAGAQDLHFSQWFNSPLTTNPANTGFIPDADYRIGANYRNQYSTVMTVPYKTMSIFADAQVMRNKITNGWLGLGGVILRDVAGSGKLTSTKIYASAAYHQMLGVASLLTAGFNAGYVNKRINASDLKFPDQFDGKFFDNTLPTDVILDNPNVNYLDVQVGMNYAYFPSDNIYINAGASIHHLNRPRESFFTSDAAGTDSRISPRYIAFANASLKLNEQVIVNPMAYYTTQARASELVGGATLQYNLSGDGETQLVGGLFVRPGDAFVPMVGFIWKNVRLTFSYDATSSSLRSATGGRGAYEFSLIQHGLYPENVGDVRQVLCPTFRN